LLELLRGLLDLVLPPICARCGRAVERSGERDRPLCRSCGRALPRSQSDAVAPPPSGLDAIVAGAAYEGDVLHWVHRFKYPRPGIAGLDPAALAVLRFLVREAATSAPGPPPLLVVPVSLHARRLRQRGFNPAALLARAVAREIAAPLDPTALVRVRDTRSQTDLDRSARRRNLRDAFRTRPGLLAPPRVWLVDDVVTTGSTVAEAARALRAAGAKSVTALCAARTPSRN
jgi:ComF family protein